MEAIKVDVSTGGVMDLMGYLKEGGLVIFLLILGSILIWSIAIERLWFISNFYKQFLLLHEKAKNLIEEKKGHEARGLCHNQAPYMASLFLTVLEPIPGNKEVWEQKVSRRLQEAQLVLKRFLWIIATFGTVSPFLGLFGTVMGIMKSFHSMGVSGKSGFAVISIGLSEALVTTAAGILVAIMAVVLHNYFQTRLARMAIETKNKLEDLMDVIAG